MNISIANITSQFRRKRSTGLPPGTPVFTGEKTPETAISSITVIDFGDGGFSEKEAVSIEECIPGTSFDMTRWILVSGLGDVENIQRAGNAFNLHPLITEDILDMHQSPKIDIYSDIAFTVLKSLYMAPDGGLASEHLSIILGRNYVITFLEKKSSIFDPLINRIKSNSGRLRREKADYLLYTIIDCVVDNYFEVTDRLDEALEEMEDCLSSSKATITHLRSIHNLRHTVTILRKSVRPLIHIVNELKHEELPNMQTNLTIYFKDLYDHIFQVVETIEVQRDMITVLLDLYLSSINNQINKIMQFLTLIGTIFLPLTFITSLYGMNFEYMPELKWHYGYFYALALMGVTAVAMAVYFKRKRWI
ncbi:MAG: magnesium and cobalt transport protein CorA [Lentisphaerae bacterium GWF2_45_14]|nr:MAG: magnesium and cobalt transport protein CorA [Lentisphaerae bacterium GWF2_45_14]